MANGKMKLKNGTEIVFAPGEYEAFVSAGGDFIAWPDDDEDDDEDFPDTIRDDDEDDDDDEDGGIGGAQPDALYFDEAVFLGAKPEMNHAFDAAAYNRAFTASVVRAGQDRLERECAEIINKAFDKLVADTFSPLAKMAEEECRKVGVDIGAAIGSGAYPGGKTCKKCSGWIPFGEVCKTCPPEGSKPCPVSHRKGAGCPVCEGKGWVME